MNRTYIAPAKPAAKSKTVWLNLGIIVLGAIAEVGRVALEQNWIPSVGWPVSVLGAINLGLRFVTKSPVKLR